jgi:hypothetical protein
MEIELKICLRKICFTFQVLQRIENIISLQQLLAKGLGNAKSLDYNPPCCHFYVDVKQLLQEKLKKPANEKRYVIVF